ncbi:HYR domain-containing protein, partial [Flavobacterium sp. ZT3R17]|uniref:HYR domain-containing protein n=1 Tax=Flavobacterium cryoconiti TaxID=3398736 RepID=UPI003A85D4CA
SVLSVVASPASLVLGSNTVTWTVTDGSNNTATSTQSVTVLDSQNPTIATLTGISVNADSGVCSYASSQLTKPTAADNCSVLSVVASPASLVLGSNTVTWTVTDGSNNTATSTQIVTVLDSQKPTITAPAATIGTTNVACTSTNVVLGTPTTGDNCHVALVTNDAPSAFSIGITTVTWTVTDGAGNTATATQKVTVTDNIKPTIVCVGDKAKITDTANCSYTVLGSEFNPISFGDNCTGSTISNNYNSTATLAGAVFPKGVTIVVWTVKDASGNTTSCNFTVTVASPLLATSTTDNPQLYFGLSTDQIATITTTPSGSTGPYTIEYTMSRPLNCNISGGSETWSTSINNSGTGCTSLMNTGTVSTASPYAITLKLMADAIITAKVTDKFGCVVYTSVKIWAEDVRCFAGKSGNMKVKICHKTGSVSNPCQEICVDESAVQSHLNHGDFVGTCTSNCQPKTFSKPIVIGKEKLIEIDSFNVIAYPNPSSHQFTLAVQGASDEKVEVLVYDMLARMVKRIEKINGQNIQFGEEFPSGEYLLIVRQGVNQKVINVIKQ